MRRDGQKRKMIRKIFTDKGWNSCREDRTHPGTCNRDTWIFLNDFQQQQISTTLFYEGELKSTQLPISCRKVLIGSDTFTIFPCMDNVLQFPGIQVES